MTKCKSWKMAYETDSETEECTTPCPYNSGSFIGSLGCGCCGCYSNDNPQKQYVECGFHLKEGE